MICLTGDIHHSSLKTNEQIYLQKYYDTTEIKIAVEYLKIIEEFNIKYNFYITGKIFFKEWENLKPITKSNLIEIGGHTYRGLPRTFFSRIKSFMTKTPAISHSLHHGSYSKQKRDVLKTIDIINNRTGKKIVSWRSHGLVYDKNTYKILKEAGIKYISDDPDWNKIRPEITREGLISHPINIIMDHDHIYHAHRNIEYVEKQKIHWTLKMDPIKESYTIEEWAKIVKTQVEKIEKKGGLATVLMHPVCMYTADGFKTARELFHFFSSFKCIWVSEIDKYFNLKLSEN